MASAAGAYREFPITDEIRELGFSRVDTMEITLEEEQIGIQMQQKKELQT
jgi:hypothetical protein